jgi:hypothetical protein
MSNKVQIKNRWSGAVLFECEVDAAIKGDSLRLGAAVKLAIKARAYLAGANLAGADLADANLAGADLADANLAGANLAGANLARANLAGADLADAKNAALAMAMTVVAPPEGEIIGWKKCRDGVLVKLRVPADAKRSNATGRKCRAEFVDVLEVIGASKGISQHDGKTKYVSGARVACDKWDDNRWNECSGGIHFFITKEEAEAW